MLYLSRANTKSVMQIASVSSQDHTVHAVYLQLQDDKGDVYHYVDWPYMDELLHALDINMGQLQSAVGKSLLVYFSAEGGIINIQNPPRDLFDLSQPK